MLLPPLDTPHLIPENIWFAMSDFNEISENDKQTFIDTWLLVFNKIVDQYHATALLLVNHVFVVGVRQAVTQALDLADSALRAS